MSEEIDQGARPAGSTPPDALPAVPEPLEPPLSGDPAVDEAMLRLAAVTAEPLEAQLAVLDAVHRTLQDRLADVEG